MKTFIVETVLRGRTLGGGAEMVDAWTMKGARRKYRRALRAAGVARPEALTLDTMEVDVEETSGEVLEILAREITA